MSNTKHLFTGAVVKEITDQAERKLYCKISDNVIDRDGEIIRLTAWDDNQLNEFIRDSGALLVSHDHSSLPVGKILRFDKREDGLFMEAQLIKGTEAAEEAWAVISQIGKIGFSVGFLSKRAEKISVRNLSEKEKASCIKAGLTENEKVRVYISVSILEVSIVSIPSLETATLVSYKSGNIRTKSLLAELDRWKQITIDEEITIEEPKKVDMFKGVTPDPDAVVKETVSKIMEYLRGSKFQQVVNSATAAEIKRLKGRVLATKPAKPYIPESVKAEDEIEVDKAEIDEAIRASVKKGLSKETLDKLISQAVKDAIDKARGAVR